MGPSTNLVGPLPPTFNFDNLSFVMWLNNDSKAYRNLAMELIFLCRFFVQAHKQSLNSSIRLRNVLIAADDALKSVAEVKDWTSEEVDKKFVKAIHLLGAFEKDFSSKAPTSDPNIGGMVTSDLEAKMDDTSKSPSAILYALKNNLHAKSGFISLASFLTLTLLP
ncbi:hypothetical protein DFH94DRAFT_92510 [Russula ochroleuca]|uniref:Uncharacterized protein n=1 Tax=Russula ochroleuca TaxID=152965 RepID=A0A9P5T641_9AGAM|nr:hypothetical protein DFH94DRAFT_92510 [Russula ochroleuca]